MNKFLVGLFVVFGGFAYAQTTNWKIVDVAGPDKKAVGYIYHAYSVGTEITNGHPPTKVVSGLRLACASKSYTVQGGNDPIIAVYWHQLPMSKPVAVDVSVDGKKIETGLWTHDGNLLFRRWSDSRNLIENMKVGKTLSVSWEENTVRRTTMFDLKTFSQNFIEFSRLCNIV